MIKSGFFKNTSRYCGAANKTTYIRCSAFMETAESSIPQLNYDNMIQPIITLKTICQTLPLSDLQLKHADGFDMRSLCKHIHNACRFEVVTLIYQYFRVTCKG